MGRSDSVAPAMADPRPLYSLDHQRRGRDGDIGSVTWHIASHAGKRRRQMVEGIIWDSHLSRECGAPGAGRAVGLGIFPLLDACLLRASLRGSRTVCYGGYCHSVASVSFLYYPFYPSAAIAAHVEGLAAGRDRRPGRHFYLPAWLRVLGRFWQHQRVYTHVIEGRRTAPELRPC